MLHKAWAGVAYEYKYVHVEERVALSSFSTFSLSMAESSVSWQLSLSASDIIIPSRMWGLNQRAACTTCTVRGALYETDLHETPGDSHYSPAAYQALNPRNTPRGEKGPARGSAEAADYRKERRWQTEMIDDFLMVAIVRCWIWRRDRASTLFPARILHICMSSLFIIES